MDDKEIKNYELAFHINPDMEEADIKKHAQDVNDLVTQSGGTILTLQEPKKIHLSYPLKQKNYGYFCTTIFSGEPETIEKINSQIKLHSEILRYLIISLPKTGKEIRTLGSPRLRTVRVRPTSTSLKTEVGGTSEKPKIEKSEASEKEIEKSIEEVIKGLE